MPDRKMLEWAESYRDSEEIGPHGLHDSTVGDLASALLALEADARRWRAVVEDLKNWKWSDIDFLDRPDPDDKYASIETLNEAADRLADEQEDTNA